MDFSGINKRDYDKYTFGRCIRQQREEIGASLRSVAKQVGISAVYLSDIENGDRYAPTGKNNIGLLYKIISVLKIPQDQIEFVIDMAYVTRGYHKDILEYLIRCEKARKFLRLAIELELSDCDWDEIIEQLGKVGSNKINNCSENKVRKLTKDNK